MPLLALNSISKRFGAHQALAEVSLAVEPGEVVAIIGFVELTRAGQLMVNVTFEPMVVYPLVAALYFALCWPLSLLSRFLEKGIDANLGVKRHL